MFLQTVLFSCAMCVLFIFSAALNALSKCLSFQSELFLKALRQKRFSLSRKTRMLEKKFSFIFKLDTNEHGTKLFVLLVDEKIKQKNKIILLHNLCSGKEKKFVKIMLTEGKFNKNMKVL